MDFCGLNNLIITGTIFPHRNIHKETWISPGDRTRNQIDHILVSRQHRTSILDTRTMRGADIASDHLLVRTKIRIKLKRIQQTQSPRRRFDYVKLQIPNIRKQFSIKLTNRYDALQNLDSVELDSSNNMERRWQEFQDTYTRTAKEVLGYKRKGQKPWVGRESWILVEERRKLKNDIQQTKSRRIKEDLLEKYRDKDKEVKRI